MECHFCHVAQPPLTLPMPQTAYLDPSFLAHICTRTHTTWSHGPPGWPEGVPARAEGLETAPFSSLQEVAGNRKGTLLPWHLPLPLPLYRGDLSSALGLAFLPPHTCLLFGAQSFGLCGVPGPGR